MLTRRALLATTTALSLTACGGSPSRKLLWSEEFDALDLASPSNPLGTWRTNDVWQPLDQGYVDFTGENSTWLVNPAQQIPDASSPFSVQDSVLTISCTRTPRSALEQAQGCPWLGGLLVSNTALPEMTFGYGYYEFRARLANTGRGMFPALWFYAARDQNPEGKAEAEIDLFEVFGDSTGQPWHSALHGTGQQVSVQTQDLDTAGWHTYGLDWTEDRMDFYHDGQVTASAPSETVEFFAGVLMSIRLNLVMDARFFAPRNMSDASTPTTLLLDIDYVRRYDRFS